MSHNSVFYRVLDQKQCIQIVDAVFQLLEESGCVVQNEKARGLMAEAGCFVEGELVKIPPSLMKWAISAAPSQVTLFDRNGEPAMYLGDWNSYFGPAITTVYTCDIETGKKRRASRKDAENAALVCDALPNIAWASAVSAVSDGITELTDLYEVYALLLNTKKPIMYWATNLKNLEYEFKMFEAVTGGIKNFVDKPFSIALVCPMDPFTHLDDGIEQLMYLAKRDAPVVYISGVSMGGSSPITAAGNIVVGVADTLVGLLISQLSNVGAPFIVSKYSDNLDMSTVTVSRSHPELIVANAATADVFHYLGIPFSLNLGDTDSGKVDQTAVFDISMQIYTAMLSSSHMNLSAGGFESCNMGDLSGLVFVNEIIDFIKPLVNGIQVSEDTLALDQIRRVGPGGNFLMEEETFKQCRSFWHTDLLKPRSLEQLSIDSVDLSEKLRSKVKQIVENGPQNPLSSEAKEMLDQILQEAESEYLKEK